MLIEVSHHITGYLQNKEKKLSLNFFSYLATWLMLNNFPHVFEILNLASDFNLYKSKDA